MRLYDPATIQRRSFLYESGLILGPYNKGQGLCFRKGGGGLRALNPKPRLGVGV